jgi:hypothetical protein
VAILQKNVPVETLSGDCKAQLGVFLEDDTAPFVDELFVYLHNNGIAIACISISYLRTARDLVIGRGAIIYQDRVLGRLAI